MGITDYISEAVVNLHLASDTFIQCSETEALDIVAQAKEKFVVGNPRAWWRDLKHKQITKHFPNGNGAAHLSEFVPTGESRMWFIPETSEANLPVYDSNLQSIVAVLHDCLYFEYYIVGKQFDWLFIETDHNMVLFTKLESDFCRK